MKDKSGLKASISKCMEQCVASSFLTCAEFINGCLMYTCLNTPLWEHSASTGLWFDYSGNHIVPDSLASFFCNNVFRKICLYFETRSKLFSSRYEFLSRIQAHHQTRGNQDPIMVYSICPTIPSLFSDTMHWQISLGSGVELLGIAFNTINAMTMYLTLRVERISMPLSRLDFACETVISCNNILRLAVSTQKFLTWVLCLSSYHPWQFFQFGEVESTLWLLQSSHKVVDYGWQIITLGIRKFQPLRRSLSQKGILPCLKGLSTGLSENSTAPCEPSVWAQYLLDGMKLAAVLRVDILQDGPIWRNPTLYETPGARRDMMLVPLDRMWHKGK